MYGYVLHINRKWRRKSQLLIIVLFIVFFLKVLEGKLVKILKTSYLFPKIGIVKQILFV